MVNSTFSIMTTERRLSESKREALIRKVERCLEYGFGSVEVVIKDHRIITTHYKETEKEDKGVNKDYPNVTGG